MFFSVVLMSMVSGVPSICLLSCAYSLGWLFFVSQFWTVFVEVDDTFSSVFVLDCFR